MGHLKLHPKQQDVVRSKARYKVIRAGRRSGKTSVEVELMLFKAVSKLVKLARAVKHRVVIFIAPTQKQARTIVWETFKQRLENLGTYNEARLEIELPTEDGGKSTIYIGGWENRENYRGMSNVIHITFDETDTCKDFFIGFQEIFRPMLIDTGGSADFIGTPKKENPNLKRLEKDFSERGEDFAAFHFTTYDNPHVPVIEIEKARSEMDNQTFKQEILAEYLEDQGALFKYNALVDMFSNTISKNDENYLVVDIADDGSDKTIFSFWHDLECYRIERFERLNTESIIAYIREFTASDRIPYSHVIVDAIGVGAGVASSSLLDGIVGFKSSFSAFRTDRDMVRLPNVGYTKEAPRFTEYRNLRSQCVFTLADLINNHKIAVKTGDVRIKEAIIEELSHYQDVSTGDGKRMATQKEDIKATIGRSPDISDTLLMRMYFYLVDKISPQSSEEILDTSNKLLEQFRRNEVRMKNFNSAR